MADNSFGTRFKIILYGESHGKIVGVIIDGVPAGLELDLEYIQQQLDMRKPGQSEISTKREESDKVKLLSGTFNDFTTGAPICMMIENKDVDSSKYERFKKYLRPSHVDYSILKRYGGYADYRGSGRFSGRITAGFVMAGAIAKQLLSRQNIFIFAYTKSIGEIIDEQTYEMDDVKNLVKKREISAVRSLNKELSPQMINLINNMKNIKDSIGGTIKCSIIGFPAGIGGPIFNSLESTLSHAMFSIPAIKGIEFGAGFRAAKMKGSEHNDPWIIKNGEIKTAKNDAGGIIGGISIGMPIEFQVAVKPTASIGKPQKTVNVEKMETTEFQLTGRHDPCIVPRAIVVVEAMTAITLLDHLICQGKVPDVLEPKK
jgi:chorismate synthase